MKILIYKIKNLKFREFKFAIIVCTFLPFTLYSQNIFAPIPLPLLPSQDVQENSPTYSISGSSKNLNTLKDILNKYNYSENKKADYILNVSQDSFKLLKAKGNIVLNTFEYRESSYLEFSDLLDAEAGYFELIELKNNGNSDFKLSDIFSKAELGKEGARIGESIELEFVYRSKTKKNGYLTIYLFTTDGMVAQIFPNKYDTNNLLNPNDNYKFPTSNATKKYKLEASTPVGNDRLLLIITEKPLLFSNDSIKNYGHLSVLQKNRKLELTKIKQEIKNLSSYGLYEIVLDIKE
jgi:hypothetical protein